MLNLAKRAILEPCRTRLSTTSRFMRGRRIVSVQNPCALFFYKSTSPNPLPELNQYLDIIFLIMAHLFIRYYPFYIDKKNHKRRILLARSSFFYSCQSRILLNAFFCRSVFRPYWKTRRSIIPFVKAH